MKVKLMRTAIQLWAENGYDAVSINQICKACGVTKGSFYHHFHDKQEVVTFYFDHFLTEMFQQEFDYQSSSINTIYQIMIQTTQLIIDWPTDMILVLFRNETQSRETSLFMNSILYQKLIELCTIGQRSGEIRDTYSAGELIDGAMTALSGNMIIWAIRNKNFDLLSSDRQYLELILKNKMEG